MNTKTNLIQSSILILSLLAFGMGFADKAEAATHQTENSHGLVSVDSSLSLTSGEWMEIASSINYDYQRFFQRMSSNLQTEFKIYFQSPSQIAEGIANSRISASTHHHGYFDHHSKSIHINGQLNRSEIERIIRHELVHFYTHQIYKSHLPVWVDEGIAELISRHPEVLKGRLSGGFDSAMSNVLHRHNTTRDQLEELLKTNAQSFYNGSSDQHYALSYAMMFYLVSENGEQSLSNAVQNLNMASLDHVAQWVERHP